MASRNKIIAKRAFALAALLASVTLAEQGKVANEADDKTSVSLPDSHSSAVPITEEGSQPEQIKVAREHMTKLYEELKRIPTAAEFEAYLKKEMNITEIEAKKILKEMDID